MAQSFGDRVKSAAGTVLGFLFFGAVLLGVGWFVGFRPIEWIADLNSPETPNRFTDYQPVREQVPVEPPPPPAPEHWACGWAPTMNENWHDDVLCTKGFEQERPLLLTDWDYVTYDDMMAAAADYEDWLNSR